MERSFHYRKSEECFQAANLAFEHELWETAVGRAYYGIFHLLIDVMTGYGEKVPGRRWKHESFRVRFVSRCNSGQHFNRNDGEVFTTLIKERMDADYHDVRFTRGRAQRTLTKAVVLRQKLLELIDA